LATGEVVVHGGIFPETRRKNKLKFSRRLPIANMMNCEKRILLVDDDVGVTTMLKERLECQPGYIVRSESDSRRAIATGRKFRPHCVLLDVVMPRADGGDVAAQFRRDPELQHVPIAFLTGMLNDDEASALRAKRQDEIYFAKPVNFGQLILFIEGAKQAAVRRAVSKQNGVGA
jgi:CheY-like chemotaxis protein